MVCACAVCGAALLVLSTRNSALSSGPQRLVRSPALQGSAPAPAARCFLTLSQSGAYCVRAIAGAESAMMVSRFWMARACAVRSAQSCVHRCHLVLEAFLCRRMALVISPKISASLRRQFRRLRGNKGLHFRGQISQIGRGLTHAITTRSRVLWESQNEPKWQQNMSAILPC